MPSIVLVKGRRGRRACPRVRASHEALDGLMAQDRRAASAIGAGRGIARRGARRSLAGAAHRSAAAPVDEPAEPACSPVTTSSGAGEVRMGEGEVLDAVYRRLEGEKAPYRLLGEREGTLPSCPAARHRCAGWKSEPPCWSWRRCASSTRWRVFVRSSPQVVMRSLPPNFCPTATRPNSSERS